MKKLLRIVCENEIETNEYGRGEKFKISWEKDKNFMSEVAIAWTVAQ